ncbi:MAG: RNA polymerase sigma factor [Paludibacteraceae bacterium]|nr:RNA polymerase sigma factor [Paludibacteraceae bacterium]
MPLLRHISTETLIERFHRPLYWHIRRMVVSHEDAEDVLQNTFVQIHVHLKDLANAEQVRSWVYRIATNEALQWLRQKHEFISLDNEDASTLLNTLATDPHTDTGDELVLKFQQAVLRLPTMQRTVFNLRYYDELPYEEIAGITKSTVGAAKTNYHIAKEKISNYITHGTITPAI